MNTQPNTADINGKSRTVLEKTVLQGALDLAAAGYRVFPCGENKNPILKGSFYGSTTDPEKIREWVRRGEMKHIGLATGALSEVAVLDGDNEEAVEQLEALLGRPPDVRTRRGGHWYLKHPGVKVTSGPIGKKLEGEAKADVKGDGGLVIAPPSPGKEWTNGIPDRASLPVLPAEMIPEEQTIKTDGACLPEDKFVAGLDVLANNYAEPGEQYDFGRHLAGYLMRNGISVEDAFNLMLAAKERQPEGVDKDAKKNILSVVKTTARRLANGETVTGGPNVDAIVPRLTKKLADALGFKKRDQPMTPADRRALANRAWAQCQDIAKRRDITAVFADTLHSNGVAGESKQIRLLYLALISRLLDKQVNVAIKGPSSGGKSYLMESVLDAFPESAYYDLSTMSEKALIYLDEDMRHRYLVIAEASGMQGDMQSYLIRTLLSEGRIRYQTAEATANGVKPRLLEMEGPTGLLVSTTAASLHPENETRLFSLLVTDTPEQTKGVFKALAQQKRKPVSLDTWRSLQTWLEGQPNEVIVPYAPALAELVPPLAVRLRRDFKAVLQLIKAHAVLHQARRERDEDGWIVATLDDYRIVRSLVGQMVAEGVGAGVPDTVRETVEAVRLLTADEAADDVDGEKVTSAKRVAAELQIDKSAASRRIKAALEDGYLKDLQEHKNRPQKLAMGDPMPEMQDVLPDPSQLRQEAENLGCWVARQSEGTSPETAEAGSGLQNPERNPSQPNNPDGARDDELWTKHYNKGVKTRQGERIGPPMTLDSAETGEGPNGRATEQPSTKKGRKRRFRRATQPSVQPSTNGHKTAPAEVLELAVEQAQPAGGAPVGKDGIPGEYGQVVSLRERAQMSINDFRGVFSEPPSRLVVNTDGRPWGWRLQEDAKQ